MVDHRARRIAAEAVRKFKALEMTNIQFEEEWPSHAKKDRAFDAIETMLWHFYSDLREHKLEGEHRLTDEGRDLLSRCVLFLNGDFEYNWPICDFLKGDFVGDAFVSALRTTESSMTPLGLSHSDIGPGGGSNAIQIFGAGAIWPFFSRVEYDSALTSLG